MLDQLRRMAVLATVVEQGSLVAAARQLQTTTSAVSQQLRALEHGIRIKAVETKYVSFGVDTPEELDQVRRLLAAPTAG